MLLAELAMQAGLPKGALVFCPSPSVACFPREILRHCDVARAWVESATLPSCCWSIHPGVLNIVHGTHDVVNGLCDHPDIKAVSFVGGNTAGKHVAERASKAGKRIQINMVREMRPRRRFVVAQGDDAAGSCPSCCGVRLRLSLLLLHPAGR